MPFDANAPFVDFLHWSWKGFTQTSTQYKTVTSYSFINPPGHTSTITPTSTTNIIVYQTKIITTVVSMTDPIVTVTSFVGNAAGGNQGVGAGGGAGASGGAVTITIGSQSSYFISSH